MYTGTKNKNFLKKIHHCKINTISESKKKNMHLYYLYVLIFIILVCIIYRLYFIDFFNQFLINEISESELPIKSSLLYILSYVDPVIVYTIYVSKLFL